MPRDFVRGEKQSVRLSTPELGPPVAPRRGLHPSHSFLFFRSVSHEEAKTKQRLHKRPAVANGLLQLLAPHGGSVGVYLPRERRPSIDAWGEKP